MAFRMSDIRFAVMESLGLAKTQSGEKLPAHVSAEIEWTSTKSEFHPHSIGEDGSRYRIRVVSSEEAKRLNPRAIRPHRIYVYDEHCGRWIFAGKYAQHCKSREHRQ